MNQKKLCSTREESKEYTLRAMDTLGFLESTAYCVALLHPISPVSFPWILHGRTGEAPVDLLRETSRILVI